MMLYRDDYYDKDDPEKAGQAEVIIGKHRNGPTGTVHLHFEGRYARFETRAAAGFDGAAPPPPGGCEWPDHAFQPGDPTGPLVLGVRLVDSTTGYTVAIATRTLIR